MKSLEIKKLMITIIFNLAIFTITLAQKHNIMILATGGTIAGVGQAGSTDTRYTAGKLPIDQLLNAVPDIHKLANVKGEQVAQIGSQAMNDEVWIKLVSRINELLGRKDVDGIVVTHGTDTQEETAYFLTLTVKSNKPVVLVGAMRSATALSADGPKNLYDAVAIAADPKSNGMGVLQAMNEKIYAARDVTKTNTTGLEAFGSSNFGPVGFIFNGKPDYYYSSTRKHTLRSEFSNERFTKLPKVDIVYGYANMTATAIDAFVSSGSKGIVMAGVGNGNLYPEAEEALKRAVAKGVVVVRSSRVFSGRTTIDSEVDDKALGFIASEDLNPQKARVLLQLALLKTTNRDKIQQYFFEY
ncbi:type II asparaginase [Arcticibacter eurypsychrophilus]|uniref:type II asparaginase n=1 Tax=Arcticibacter eurypsychrophilus TaxID=1434752 RepID=UPI00084DA2DD|nr:type II asparaginase [Arcticibacter eurypsychrophilus]